jgi:hypothetical protein
MTTTPKSARLWVPTSQARPSPAATEVRTTITCRACQVRDEVGLDNEVLLYGSCRLDPTGALDRLKTQADLAEAQLYAAGAHFQATLQAAHARDRQRYTIAVVTVANALSLQPNTPTLQRVVRSLARASSADDGLADLLAAEAQLREMVHYVQTTYRQLRLGREECLLAIDSG